MTPGQAGLVLAGYTAMVGVAVTALLAGRRVGEGV
jgi:hypothetical protein